MLASSPFSTAGFSLEEPYFALWRDCAGTISQASLPTEIRIQQVSQARLVNSASQEDGEGTQCQAQGPVERAPVMAWLPEEHLRSSLLSGCSCLPETQMFSFVFNLVSPHVLPLNPNFHLSQSESESVACNQGL